MSIVQICGQQGLDRFFGLATLRAKVHERDVDDDPVEPGRKLRAACEIPKRSKGVQIRGLDDVAGIFFVADQTANDREEATSETCGREARTRAHRLPGGQRRAPPRPGARGSVKTWAAYWRELESATIGTFRSLLRPLRRTVMVVDEPMGASTTSL